jgi:hypothetical protein
MDLIFNNPDHETLHYAKAMDSLSKIISEETAAEFITDKIRLSSGKDLTSIIANTKKILGRLFLDRKAFLSFLPVFKEKLQNSLSKPKAKDIVNEVCASFAPGFSFEDEELALGTISELEFKDIVDGLNTLKTVHPDKPTIEKEILDFNADESRLCILKYLLVQNIKLDLFRNILGKLIASTENMLRKDNLDYGKEMLGFFQEQISAESDLDKECKQLIIEAAGKLPALLLEKIVINILSSHEEDVVRNNFEELFLLLGETLIALLVKIYAREENLPHAKVVREMIFNHYTPNIFNLNIDLKKELTQNVMRIIDLLQTIKSEDTLPLLWDITFHENAILAQRALKLIAIRGSDAALSLLLKTLEHPQLHMQIAGIEYLGSYRTEKVKNILIPIARGQIQSDFDEAAIKDLRISALRSIMFLDEAAAKKLLVEVRSKRRLLIIPVEPKPLRVFAKEQLKRLAKK